MEIQLKKDILALQLVVRNVSELAVMEPLVFQVKTTVPMDKSWYHKVLVKLLFGLALLVALLSAAVKSQLLVIYLLAIQSLDTAFPVNLLMLFKR